SFSVSTGAERRRSTNGCIKTTKNHKSGINVRRGRDYRGSRAGREQCGDTSRARWVPRAPRRAEKVSSSKTVRRVHLSRMRTAFSKTRRRRSDDRERSSVDLRNCFLLSRRSPPNNPEQLVWRLCGARFESRRDGRRVAAPSTSLRRQRP